MTHAVVHASASGDPSFEPYSLTIANGNPVPLTGSGKIALSLKVAFDLEQDSSPGQWLAATVGYLYSIRDLNHCLLLSYHWHPSGQSPVKFPHLHLGPAAEIGMDLLARAHLPTGVVTANDILRLLIVDMAVRPLRRDWERVLGAAPGA